MTMYCLLGGQREKLAKACQNNSAMTIRLTKDELNGSDELMLAQRQINKLIGARAADKGSDIKISKTQIRKALQHGVVFGHLYFHWEQKYCLMR